jgi:FdrA protein
VPAHVHLTATLEEAGLLAAKLAGADLGEPKAIIASQKLEIEKQAAALKTYLKPGQRYLRALFSGGTLCYEAQVIWREFIPEPVFSNAPLDAAFQMADSTRSEKHAAVDLGEEEFTVGRPHPMIDNDLRVRRLLQEARDPEVAVILLDVVIGHGAHADPASELGKAIQQAQKAAAQEGREILFVASVTGTEQDPQSLSRTTGTLKAAGVHVLNSNAAAARLAGMIVS